MPGRGLSATLMVVAILAVAGSAHGQQPVPDPPPRPTPALTVDGNWNSFSWSGTLPIDMQETPFTFSGPAVLDVTDAQCLGDRFEVFDNGMSVGLTSAPSSDPACTVFVGSPPAGCDPGFMNPGFSSGTFSLGTGAHSIVIRTLAGSFNFGASCLRASPGVPTLPILALVLLGLAVLAMGISRLWPHRAPETVR